MSAVESLIALGGTWAGTSRLILPGEPDRACPSALEMGTAARDKFSRVGYTWSFDGEPHEGLLVFGQSHGGIHGCWIDSWHMGDVMMALHGAVADDGSVVLRGSYAVEEGTDWGWRIDLRPSPGALHLAMYNVSPEGEEYLGVSAEYALAR